jgi:GNAT superfamily N-acetyltransferase
MQQSAIHYAISPALDNAALNALFAAAWPDHRSCDFQAILARSLAYCCALADAQLIGFVNLAWDGGVHCFLLDTTVHPSWQRQGVGRQLVAAACAVAHERGIEWVHVDYEPQYAAFYAACGFSSTAAGLINLREE